MIPIRSSNKVRALTSRAGGFLAKSWFAKGGRARTPRSASARIPPLMRIPVPWVFVLAYLAGVVCQTVAPLPLHSAPILRISHIAGVLSLIGGAALAVWCLGLFRAAHTTTVPFETASQLVRRGPYRFSRNPMYVSLTLVYLGEAGILAQIWPLLFLPLTLAYIHRTVIPVEEARLREVFGDAYEHYCAGVRRWL
jgi:protein-S-isoprenylcysteine O-methyltransferase Ste14